MSSFPKILHTVLRYAKFSDYGFMPVTLCYLIWHFFTAPGFLLSLNDSWISVNWLKKKKFLKKVRYKDWTENK